MSSSVVTVHLAHIDAVQRLQLLEVEPRRAPVDVLDLEPADHLVEAHDLVVAMAPAEAHEVVLQRLRQIAQRTVGVDAECAVALRKLAAVGAVDQRDVCHDRHFPAHRLVDDRLAGGVGQVIVARG